MEEDVDESDDRLERRLDLPFPYAPVEGDWEWLDVPANPAPLQQK